MASGSSGYKSINTGRAAGFIQQSGAASRSASRTPSTVFQTSNPKAANYSPF